MAVFSTQTVFISDFLAQTQNQRPNIDPCAKFQPNWTKAKESQILTSINSENCYMTSYARGSGDVIKTFNAFGRFCARVPSCQV